MIIIFIFNEVFIFLLPEGTILGNCIFFLISMSSYKIIGFFDDEIYLFHKFMFFNVTKRYNLFTHLLYTINKNYAIKCFTFFIQVSTLQGVAYKKTYKHIHYVINQFSTNFIVWLFALKLSENEKVSWSYHECRNFAEAFMIIERNIA